LIEVSKKLAKYTRHSFRVFLDFCFCCAVTLVRVLYKLVTEHTITIDHRFHLSVD